MDNENLRNTLLFLACALTLLLAYQAFILAPIQRRQAQAQHPPSATAPSAAARPVPLARALAASPRVTIDTPSLTGSISLRGARLDHLMLKRYRATTNPRSPNVELLRPEGSANAWFAEVGWAGAEGSGLPDSDAQWTAPAGAVLTPGKPVELSYANGHGLLFHRTISVDNDYMFTVTDRVTNGSGAPVDLQPYAFVEQRGLPSDAGHATSHEGAVGVLDRRLVMSAYKAWKKTPPPVQTSTGGWIGITEKYWLTALVPDQAAPISGMFRAQAIGGADAYQAGFTGPVRRLAPGQSIASSTRIFAGAKSVALLRRYQERMAIPRLEDAVDWGWCWFLAKPIFLILQGLRGLFGNVGVAILLLTLCIRLPLFPLANRTFASATKLKKIQPLVDEVRGKFEKDPARLHQEMAALYAREKVNPLAGCIPMLLPLPIFFALSQVLSVTIELRHAPFFGWITDLSARDPSTLWTLFGLIPWNPAHAPLIGTLLDGAGHVGVWPLIYGATAWLAQAMSPPASVDPAQQRIIGFMPLIITVTFAQLAAGVVIYYVWSSLLTIAQQYVNMRLFKVDNPIDRLISRLSLRKGLG
jgi:YidC/Oxa1 family membrane protein insertase